MLLCVVYFPPLNIIMKGPVPEVDLTYDQPYKSPMVCVG